MSSDKFEDLKGLLGANDPRFWTDLAERSLSTSTFNELMVLARLRKRALTLSHEPAEGGVPLRVALVGGSTLYPISELLEHLISIRLGPVELLSGEYNNYRSEMLDGSDDLDRFRPDVIVVLPDDKSCRYLGNLTDERPRIEREVEKFCSDLLLLCEAARDRYGAEIVLCNFLSSPYFDLGEFGSRNAASEWNFKRSVNLTLSERVPNYVHICDLEFIGYRLGGLKARDDRSWLESKQAFSPSMQVAAAGEMAHVVCAIKTAPKKVLVLDLDNTLWGGVIGDDGLEGIEIGDTSARGEAFKAFQSYIVSLIDRGVLLAVCSKNDFDNAIEPFRSHPEMVLRVEHFVSFKANWEPKAANITEMAEELSLGLDSFIFVDDNPAEIEIVKQFAPQVTTILLSDDPSTYVRQLRETRLFERGVVTEEDSERTRQYRQNADRRMLQKTAVDMDSYLESLEMTAEISDFNRINLPRITQLINKSNQFNLTTKRRSQAEVEAVMLSPEYQGFTVRLSDRFGDHGLISIVIVRISPGSVLEIDSWIMSCRVLKRQVEELVLNEIVRRARLLGCKVIRGRYIPTPKNGMVRNLLPSFGFDDVGSTEECLEFELHVDEYSDRDTYINLAIDTIYDSSPTDRNTLTVAVNI